MRVSIHELFGVELPIIQAPMAGVQDSALAIAVSNAGGLGSLPGAMLSMDALRAELAAVAAGTSRPVNVNFFCHTPPPVDARREDAWRDVLRPYYEELGLDIGAIPANPGRASFSHAAADVLSEFKPPVVSFHFGLPSPDLLQRMRAWGAMVLSSATTVDEARWLEARGADAIIAQGSEAGGHRGLFLSDDLTTQIGTLALVPQIVSAVSVPVIAAGGIADAAGVRGGAGPRRGRRADRHGVPAVPRSHDQRGAPRRAEERRRAPHHPHQRLHRPARPRHRQPHDPGGWADQHDRAGVSAGRGRARSPAREGRSARLGRFLAAVVRSEPERLQGDSRRRPDARAGASSDALKDYCCRGRSVRKIASPTFTRWPYTDSIDSGTTPAESPAPTPGLRPFHAGKYRV